MFALFQGSKDVYNEQIRYFILAIAPLVITTISLHNFCFISNLENEFYVNFTDKWDI